MLKMMLSTVLFWYYLGFRFMFSLLPPVIPMPLYP